MDVPAGLSHPLRRRASAASPMGEGGPAKAGSGEGSTSAFSLIEIMVVVALLSVIVLGLMAMFTQTQRAFRTGMAQTDVLESGRMAADLLARELEQTTPSYFERTNIPPNSDIYQVPNFEARLVNYFFQPLPGYVRRPGDTIPLRRTNVMSDAFFVMRQNQTWTGIGYFVRINRIDNPALPGGIGIVGTLFRFETNNTISQFEANPGGLFAGFNRARDWTDLSVTNGISRILDGVIHFRIRPFDLSGWMLTNNPLYSSYADSWVNLPAMVCSNLVVSNSLAISDELWICQFFSNAVPASVEVEAGILEQQAYERYLSLPTASSRIYYLTNQEVGAVGKVHLFRQRIPVRNVDPAAYFYR
jgi:prepilin-type N-terminal cleavage/methylation domain-containing protein